MKRTCEGCRALEEGDCVTGATCLLGYKLDGKLAKPLEECPKPKTHIKFATMYISKSRALSNEEKCNG